MANAKQCSHISDRLDSTQSAEHYGRSSLKRRCMIYASDSRTDPTRRQTDRRTDTRQKVVSILDEGFDIFSPFGRRRAPQRGKCSCKILSSQMQQFISYRVGQEKICDDAQNNSADAFTGSNISKSMAWDVTVPDTFVESHLSSTSS